MSGIVVQKYGGSSVADTNRIKVVARRVADTREQGKQVCVVVSAMGDTTDELLSRAAAITPSPSRRELDMLLTCGERASMALLSMAVSDLGYEAISFTGSQCGILTNDRHSGARIVEVRPFRVQDELDRGRVVIVAGFQGVSYKREITTLGRGGSDTTAVALAAALGADYCELCSDVDGVYSADPRVVKAAELRHALDYDEMAELASTGAKVIAAEAVEFARRSGVALWARATAGGGEGTRIDRIGGGGDAVAGVTGQTGLVRLTATGAGAGSELLGFADGAGIEIVHYAEDGGRSTLVFSLDDVPDWAALRLQLSDGIEIGEECGAVSVVGARTGARPASIASAKNAATAAGIEVRGAGAAPLRITLFCDARDVDRLVATIHAVFVEGA